MTRANRAPILAIVLAAFGCNGGAEAGRGDTAMPTASAAVEAPARLGLGSAAAPALLARIDIDANPAGAGLPAGRGVHAEGARVYAARCASCHGVNGEGVAPVPRLVGPAADTGFRFGNDVTLAKTAGNYWPYATTLYDYIHRAMPADAPGSLPPDDVYALVAWLLAENGVIGRGEVMDARTLPAVRMPARSRFVRDDRTGGPVFR